MRRTDTDKPGKPFYASMALFLATVLVLVAVNLLLSLHMLSKLGEQARQATAAAMESSFRYLRRDMDPLLLLELAEPLAKGGALSRLGKSKRFDPADDDALLVERRLKTLSDSAQEGVAAGPVGVYLYFFESGYAMGVEVQGADVRTAVDKLVFSEFEAMKRCPESYLRTRLTYEPDGSSWSIRMVLVEPGVFLAYVNYSKPPIQVPSEILSAVNKPEVYLYDTFGTVVAMQPETACMQAYSFDSLGEADAGSFAFELAGLPYHCYYETLEDSGIRLALFAMDSAASARRTLILLLAVSMAIIVGLGLLFSFFAARHLYRPVQALMSALPVRGGQGLRDDYGLIGEALHTMGSTLSEQRMLLQRTYLGSLLRGETPGAVYGNGLFIREEGAPFVLCALTVDAAQEDEHDADYDPAALEERIYSHAEASGLGSICAWEAGLMMLVFDMREQGMLSLLSFLENLRRLLEQTYGLLISIYVSELHRGEGEILIAREEAARTAAYSALLEKYNTVLCYETIKNRLPPAEREEPPLPEEERHETGDDRFDQMLAYVAEHYREPGFHAGMVAERFDTSQSNITRLFKKHNGGGFLDHVHKLRVAKATLLLANTELPLTEIAMLVGYTNTLTMTRAFKRYAGNTPGSLRKR